MVMRYTLGSIASFAALVLGCAARPHGAAMRRAADGPRRIRPVRRRPTGRCDRARSRGVRSRRRLDRRADGPPLDSATLDRAAHDALSLGLSRTAGARLTLVHSDLQNDPVTKSYAVADGRAQLSEILDEVEAGRAVQLTRRGRAVAVVLSAEKYDALRRERSSFADAYGVFTSSRAMEGVDLDEAYFASLRDRGTGRRTRGLPGRASKRERARDYATSSTMTIGAPSPARGASFTSRV